MSAPALDHKDRSVFRAWLADVARLSKDAVEVAEDQTLPIGKRRLGRASARALLAEAKGALQAQLRYARRGLAVNEAWIRVNVTDETHDGRRRVWFEEPTGAHRATFTPEADLDGDLLRVAVLREEEGDLVTVLIPSAMPGDVGATVRRADLLPARATTEEP